jgi:uncharacterized membrane protein
MKNILFTLFLALISLFGTAQMSVCDQINISTTGTAGNSYSFQVASNADSLVAVGLISSNNVQHRWRAYSYNNMVDAISQSFDTSLSCVNCLWTSTLSQDSYTANFMDTITIMVNMTILDNATCVTLFGVAFDPSANNNSNGGFTYMQLNQSTGIPTSNNDAKVLYKTYNLLGQEVNADELRNEILVYVYSDGSTEKKYISR